MKRFVLAAALLAPSPLIANDGFYAGIIAGGGVGDREVFNSGWVAGSSGGLIGGVVGYSMNLLGFVVGLEADYQLANLSFTQNDLQRHGLDHFGTLRALAGVELGPIQLYGTAGFAAAATHFTPDYPQFRDEQYTIGWTTGFGFKLQVTDSVALGADLLHIDLGEPAYFSTLLGNTSVRTTDRVGRVKLTFSF